MPAGNRRLRGSCRFAKFHDAPEQVAADDAGQCPPGFLSIWYLHATARQREAPRNPEGHPPLLIHPGEARVEVRCASILPGMPACPEGKKGALNFQSQYSGHRPPRRPFSFSSTHVFGKRLREKLRNRGAHPPRGAAGANVELHQLTSHSFQCVAPRAIDRVRFLADPPRCLGTWRRRVRDACGLHARIRA